MSLPQKVRHLRIEKALSQDRLAKLAGISRAYLNQIENGKRLPSTKTLLRLSETLEVDAGFLLTDDPAIINLRSALDRDEIKSVVLELIQLLKRSEK